MTVPLHEPAPQPVMRGLTVRVHGTPAAQGSKRVVNGRMIESSKRLPGWREAVRHETQQALLNGGTALLEGAVRLDVWFTLTRPKSHYSAAGAIKPRAPHFPAITPDLDKLTRAVCDALVAGGGIADDKQIVSLHAFKIYDRTPGAFIRVTTVNESGVTV